MISDIDFFIDIYLDTYHYIQNAAGVKMLPCSSGWCKKFVGGSQDKLKSDQAIEHERGCLTRGPPDNKPRCFEHDFGLMCICKGDLCNEASSIGKTHWQIISAFLIGWGALNLY